MIEPQEHLTEAISQKLRNQPSQVEPSLVVPPMSPGLAEIYEILSQEFETGKHELAERHNEHRQ